MNLLQLKEKTEEKKRVKLLINKAELEEKEENAKLSGLTVLLKKEYADVQRLEGSGLTALFYGMLGNKVEKLDKERQEYLSAKLKYDNCKKEIEALATEIINLKQQFVEFGSPEEDYKRVLNEKSARLKANQDEKFLKFEELLEICFVQKKEVNEAIYAGERAMQGLNYAIQSLHKAKSWGTVDLLGGGLITTAVKHSNIDEAKNLIHDVQLWLRKFKRELSDVQNIDVQEMDVKIDSFSTFADYFFDNLIFDWVVQSKIHRSMEGCQKVYSQVSTIVSSLQQMDIRLTQKYKSTQKEFNRYIESFK